MEVDAIAQISSWVCRGSLHDYIPGQLKDQNIMANTENASFMNFMAGEILCY